jgi:hypothetical protein
MAHLDLALPMAILAMPLVMLVGLRVFAVIADARVAERSARLAKEIEAASRMQVDAPADPPARLTGTPPRDQG